MGLFNFVKEAGEKLWDTVTGNASAEDQSAKLKEHLDKSGLPGTDKVDVQVVDGKAVVTGDAVSQELKEKILVAIGNVAGISGVEDKVAVAQSDAESRFYTVKKGDTLSAISKEMYGNANLYNKIFEANKPMLSSPDKIYPGQVLRIRNNLSLCQSPVAYRAFFVLCNRRLLFPCDLNVGYIYPVYPLARRQARC